MISMNMVIGSAYCQMIRDPNKEKRLAWARKNIGEDFSDCIFSDETTVQMETHRRFCCTKSGFKPRYKTEVSNYGSCVGSHK